jgi:hypothetical protein
MKNHPPMLPRWLAANPPHEPTLKVGECVIINKTYDEVSSQSCRYKGHVGIVIKPARTNDTSAGFNVETMTWQPHTKPEKLAWLYRIQIRGEQHSFHEKFLTRYSETDDA